jgi:hypothetical protein
MTVWTAEKPGELGGREPTGAGAHVARLEVDLDLQARLLIGQIGRLPE